MTAGAARLAAPPAEGAAGGCRGRPCGPVPPRPFQGARCFLGLRRSVPPTVQTRATAIFSQLYPFVPRQPAHSRAEHRSMPQCDDSRRPCPPSPPPTLRSHARGASTARLARPPCCSTAGGAATPRIGACLPRPSSRPGGQQASHSAVFFRLRTPSSKPTLNRLRLVPQTPPPRAPCCTGARARAARLPRRGPVHGPRGSWGGCQQVSLLRPRLCRGLALTSSGSAANLPPPFRPPIVTARWASDQMRAGGRRHTAGTNRGGAPHNLRAGPPRTMGQRAIGGGCLCGAN